MIYLYQDTERREGATENKSRADYFKERRKKTKAFYVEIDRDKMEAFEEKLSGRKKTKKEWLEEKIDEEVGE